MLSSMTGFSRVTLQESETDGVIELRSLNHKQLDINLRISEKARFFEEKARMMLKKNFDRGRIDCSIIIEDTVTDNEIKLNPDVLANLAEVKNKIESNIKIKMSSNLIEFLRWPGVCQRQDTDTSKIDKILESSFKDAINDLKNSRLSEGKELTRLISEKLSLYTSNFNRIIEKQPQINKEVISKFKQRILDLTQECDHDRLEQECAILLQKMDIAEELDRINYHLESTNSILKKGGIVGRKLGFILQEVHRETNTLGAKSSQIEITNAVLEMKLCLEQMREQIQNVE